MPDPEDPSTNQPFQSNPAADDATVSDPNPADQPSVAPDSIEGLFLQALQIDAVEDRDAFLHDHCGDAEQRQRVSALLRAYNDAGSFLETPAGGARPDSEVSLSFLKPADKDGVLGTIGGYEVLDIIGRGGMGVVLRAVDLKLNRVVAVKALLPELAANPNSRRRFLREAQAAAAVSHPHVVTIHAVDDAAQEIGGKPVPPYLVMECVVGQSLQQKLDNVGTLRLAEILRISRQIAEGLGAAHKQGLIHRDIKPANILLENGIERVKITDFGLARAIDDITVTRTGEVCGTPQYMSPEQAGGERVDHRSDLFSLGCVMYAMCTGHSPFRGDSIAHVIKRVTQDSPRPIADQNPEIPAWLCEIVNCLLQKDVEHRFQSSEGVVAILDQHLSRIQHPTGSGSHTNINRQIPEGVDKTASPVAARTARKSPKLIIPGWIRSLSRVWLLLVIAGTFVMIAVPLAMGLGSTERAIIYLMCAFPSAIMSSILMRKALQKETIAIALFIGLGPIGLLLYLMAKDNLQEVAIESKTPATTTNLAGNADTRSRTIDDHGNSMAMPEFSSSPAAMVLTWLILTIMGIAAAAFVNPQQALELEQTKVVENALTYPAIFFGLWVLQMIANLIFNAERMPMRKWALFSSSCFLCMGFGFFWATVVRMPTPVNSNFVAPRTVIGAAILPTMIWLMYNWYVCRELQNGWVRPRQLTPQQRKNARTGAVVGLLLVAGSFVFSHFADRLDSPKAGSTQVANAEVSKRATTSAAGPTLVVTHPKLGCEIRKLMINGGGSMRSSKTPTQTVIYLDPEALGTRISVHLILMDGREWTSHGLSISKPQNSVSIADYDLETPGQSLVEILDDAPGREIRMIGYPTQNIGRNEFHISNPPFHKALQPGEHRIVIDYRIQDRILDEEVPGEMVRWWTLNHRITVPDTKPLKLSLKTILDEHGSKVRPHQAKAPDFKPLPANAEKDLD